MNLSTQSQANLVAQAINAIATGEMSFTLLPLPKPTAAKPDSATLIADIIDTAWPHGVRPIHFGGRPLDLTGLFCTSLIERLSRGRNGKDAKEDVYARADRREAEAGRGADRTRPDGSTGVPRG